MIRSHKLNQEKFQALVSGLADNGRFNKRVGEVRRALKIPKDGLKTNEEAQKWQEDAIRKHDRLLDNKKWKEKVIALDKNDPKYDEKRRELHRKLPMNCLTYAIEDILNENSDLSDNFKGPIRDYILFNTMPSPGNFRVYSRYEGDKRVTGIEIYGQLSKQEMRWAMRTLEMINDDLPRMRPYENFEQDIEILKLSKKKGEAIKSSCPDLEEDTTFSNETIIARVLPEELDTESRKKSNKDLIRKRKSRAKKRIKQHFPRTYKGCDT